MMQKAIKKAAVFIIAASALFCHSTLAMAGPVTQAASAEELTHRALNCADGETIRLLADIQMDNTLYFDCGGKTVTLDLGGRRLEIIDRSKNGIAITGENGILIIKDTLGTGRLHAECGFLAGATDEDTAGIRVLDTKQTLIIDGAEVYAKGGSLGAGIGGSHGETGTVIVKSGSVTAEGGMFGAGIGGGMNHFSGNIIIENGNVNGIGGMFAAGIGTGGFESMSYPAVRGNKITIYDGNITAAGGVNGAGIGGGQYQSAVALTISDGKVDAAGGSSGAGIGSGNLNFQNDLVDLYQLNNLYPGDIIISGGNVKAVGGKAAAGIGTGEGNSEFLTELKGSDRNILIDGGNVIAAGGTGGAGIGGGAFVSGGTVEICPADRKTVYVEATGGKDGAGIGGGKGGVAGALLSIGGGAVTATGGENASGIGTGAFTREHIQPTAPFFSDRKNVSISGGQVTAYGGNNGAAIGGGTGGAGVDLKISGEAIIEAVSKYKTSIGAGQFSHDQGSCTIDSGNIRVNKSMGPQPKNSRNQNVYLGMLSLITEDSRSPVAGAVIETIADDAYTYSAVTDAYGAAAMYLPADNVGLSIRTADGSLRNRVLGKISVTEDNKGAAALAVTNDEPVKILSREHTYYLSDSNTYQIEYSGGLNETTAFSIINNECGMDIDKITGLLTIPVHITPGEHSFTILAWKDGQVTDSAPFTLRVVDVLSAITPSSREIVTEVNRENLIRIDPWPADSEIAYCNWQVIYGSSSEHQLAVLPDEKGQKAVSFNSRNPGVYTVMAAAQDARGNKAWDTVRITVVDPAIAVFANQDAAKIDWDIVEGNITAWSIERTSPETAVLTFAYDGSGPYKNAVIPAAEQAAEWDNLDSLAVPEEEFSDGGFFIPGRNSITISDLKSDTAYDYYIKTSDARRNERVIGKFAIPSFFVPDILPPVITDIQVERLDSQRAAVYFTSDEPGRYTYAFKEEPSGQEDISINASEPMPLLHGKNTYIKEDIQNRGPYILSMTTEDQNGNKGEPLLIHIPEYVRQDGIQPVLTSGFAIREDGKTAKIGFNTTVEGECYYVLGNRSEPSIGEMREVQTYAQVGNNEIVISDLTNNEACDIFLSVKNTATGKASDVLKIPVEAYVEKNSESPQLKTGDAYKTGNGLALLTFTSDKEGEYFFSVGLAGEPQPELPLDRGGHEMSAGENIISVFPFASDNGEYIITVAGKDENGNISNQIQMKL